MSSQRDEKARAKTRDRHAKTVAQREQEVSNRVQPNVEKKVFFAYGLLDPICVFKIAAGDSNKTISEILDSKEFKSELKTQSVEWRVPVSLIQKKNCKTSPYVDLKTTVADWYDIARDQNTEPYLMLPIDDKVSRNTVCVKLEKAEGDIKELENELSLKSAAFESSEEAVKRLQSDALAKSMRELDAKFNRQAGELSELRNQISDLRAENIELRANDIELRANDIELRANDIELRDQISDLRAENIEQRDRIDHLETEVQRLRPHDYVIARQLLEMYRLKTAQQPGEDASTYQTRLTPAVALLRRWANSEYFKLSNRYVHTTPSKALVNAALIRLQASDDTFDATKYWAVVEAVYDQP